MFTIAYRDTAPDGGMNVNVVDFKQTYAFIRAVALDWSEALRLLHMLMFSGVLVLGSTTLCYSDQAQAAE